MKLPDKCYYCEREFAKEWLIKDWSDEKPIIRTKDHIVPKSKGGSSKKINIIYCCERCNTFKGQSLLNDFINVILKMLNGEMKARYGREYLHVVLKNAANLNNDMVPFQKDLFRDGPNHKGMMASTHEMEVIKANTFQAKQNDEWPISEEENKFDWSLSIHEIDKRYNPAPLKAKQVRIGRYKEDSFDARSINPIIQKIADNSTLNKVGTLENFENKFKNKYPYVHSLIQSTNPDLLRWLYDNILTKKEWIS